ncbi:glycosyltransferase family 2 protein [Candidatus Saccharibacteria bacterium]|nr:glycosyltransferase family 2 protein [Candidatus Saccharibacteria bacterium]
MNAIPKSVRSNVFVSIIIPVLNAEEYLNQCVDSVLGQTYKNFELILIDDGSTDKSPDICGEYAKRDERVQVIYHKDNTGQTSARKDGLAKAKGEYIYFVDADDWLEDSLLELVYAAAERDESDVITFDAYFNYANHQNKVKQLIPSGVFDKNEMIQKIYPKMIYSGKFFYFGVYAAMWNKVVRRSVIEPNLDRVDNSIRVHEDGLTTFAVMLDAEKLTVLGGEHLYHYRDCNPSVTRSYCKEQFSGALLFVDTLRKLNSDKNVYDLSGQIDYYFMYYIYSIFIEEFYYRYKKSFASRLKYLRDIMNNDLVQESLSRIDPDTLPGRFKEFFVHMRNKNFAMLVFNTLVIAMQRRTKLYLKKLLGKY